MLRILLFFNKKNFQMKQALKRRETHQGFLKWIYKYMTTISKILY